MSNVPDQSAETSNGREHVATALEEDHVALLEARLAVEQAAVVKASVHRDVEDEFGALGSHGSKGGQPEDHHDAVEHNDGDNVVELIQSWDLFCENGIQADDPSDDGLLELLDAFEFHPLSSREDMDLQ